MMGRMIGEPDEVTIALAFGLAAELSAAGYPATPQFSMVYYDGVKIEWEGRYSIFCYDGQMVLVRDLMRPGSPARAHLELARWPMSDPGSIDSALAFTKDQLRKSRIWKSYPE